MVRDRAAGTGTLKQTRYIEQAAEMYKGQITSNSTPIDATEASHVKFDNLKPWKEGDKVSPINVYLPRNSMPGV